MLVLVVTMAVNPRCWTSCCFHLLSVMDLADNFNSFPTSEANPSCSKSSFPGACEALSRVLVRLFPGCLWGSFPGACESLSRVLVRLFPGCLWGCGYIPRPGSIAGVRLYYVITQMVNFGETYFLEIDVNDYNSLLPGVNRIKVEDEA